MSPCDFNRRQFLQYTGAAGAATMAATLSMDDVAQAASATPLPVGTPILVIVTLYGGNDGLNTVVPYLDPAYLSNRPGMSFTAADVIPLTNSLSLNGTMTGFASLWAANKLAIVLGTSYPNPNLSHFSSMAIWQSGVAGRGDRERLDRSVPRRPPARPLPGDRDRLHPDAAAGRREPSRLDGADQWTSSCPTDRSPPSWSYWRERRGRTRNWSPTPPAPSPTSTRSRRPCRRS